MAGSSNGPRIGDVACNTRLTVPSSLRLLGQSRDSSIGRGPDYYSVCRTDPLIRRLLFSAFHEAGTVAPSARPSTAAHRTFLKTFFAQGLATASTLATYTVPAAR